ncbi:hypothetical protein RCO48_07345 [Peribacillus frigoritolerans]|nr:hypothetical protein [Peribacillus frigoritolerans]
MMHGIHEPGNEKFGMKLVNGRKKLYQYEPTDLAALYDKWLEQGFALLPENVQQQFF